MVSTHTVGPFQENCHLVRWGEALAIVDPGDEAPRLLKAIQATGVKPGAILITHAHLDHVGAVAELKRALKVPVVAPAGERELLQAVPLQCTKYGLPPYEVPEVDLWWAPGMALEVGGQAVEVIEAPGHSPAGLCFRFGDELCVGDVLFAGSVGRTDLYGGSWPVLEASIRQGLFTLPGHLRVHPGHGPSTDIQTERSTNPFFV